MKWAGPVLQSVISQLTSLVPLPLLDRSIPLPPLSQNPSLSPRCVYRSLCRSPTVRMCQRMRAQSRTSITFEFSSLLEHRLILMCPQSGHILRSSSSNREQYVRVRVDGPSTYTRKPSFRNFGRLFELSVSLLLGSFSPSSNFYQYRPSDMTSRPSHPPTLVGLITS